MKDKIINEARRACGSGARAIGFELGAEWVLTQILHINDLARQAFDTAIIRGKTNKDLSHNDTFFGILEELKEFRQASEVTKSEHLPEYTEAQEELADVLICCLTELHRRGTNIEEILKAKIDFNKTRV
jgi:NTP pyrophosphatase (non-canonical NTP hydrolase)